MIHKIIIGIVISTISGILIWVFRGFFVKSFRFLKNRYYKLRLNQIKQKSFKEMISLNEEFKNKLKVIVDGFSDCLDYRKSCSLTYIIQDIQRLDPSEGVVLSYALKETNLLKEWYSFYKCRIDSTNSSCIAELFNEFGFILARLQRIWEEVIKSLNEDSSRKLKMNSYGYPLFKQIFTNTTNEFSKLTKEASKNLEGIREWLVIVLPEL